MVSSRLVLGILVVHHLATSASAVQATKTEAAEAVSVHARTASTLKKVEAGALHTRSLEASGAHLRGRRAQSSHGARANVFRAGRVGQRGGLRRAKAPEEAVGLPGAVPLYIPKMGLANVTEPTPFPPPPPVLKPWKDHQPLDTAIGNYLISGFIAQPTVTPPPTQASMDLAFSCPTLLTWPSEVAITVPSECTSMDSGNWTDSNDNEHMQWASTCIDLSETLHTPSASPVVTYTIPSTGDLFGSSQEVTNWMGETITEVRDCGAAVVFTIEEKIYKQAGKADDDACQKHKSCDGVIYFQWFMYNAAGKLVAQTPYTTLFQDNFDILDGGKPAVKIATVSRSDWEPDDMPKQGDCKADAKPPVWNLKYEGNPPGDWATVTNQWPLAIFMTMHGLREQNRQPNGSMLFGTCQVVKTSGAILLLLVIFCLCVLAPMTIFLLFSAPMMKFFNEAQERFFPKRMGKPGMYGN